VGWTYLDVRDYSAGVTAALNAFWEALTHRWRVEAAKAIRLASDIPQPGILECSARPDPVRWDYRQPEARGHLNGDYCTYLAWVDAGQPGELSGVTCSGARGPLSSDIGCGVGGILAQVEDWAWAERMTIVGKLPQLEGHDLSILEDAYQAFVRIGGTLGLEDSLRGQGGDDLPAMAGRPLVQDIEWMAGEDSEKTWFAGWTGLAASNAKDGFIASTKRTLRNQSILLGWLANLYSDRAAIIEAGRNNTLELLKGAAKALNEKQTITTDLTKTWTVVNGAATVIGTAAIFPVAAPVAGPLAAIIGLAGFLGQNLAPSSSHKDYGHGLSEAVLALGSEISKLNGKLDDYETGYSLAASTLRNELAGVHSYNLELYDITRNDSQGNATNGGYTANVDFILDVAQRCYEASEGYSEVLRQFAATAVADLHLAGRHMTKNDGDRILVDVRDTLESFLQKTTARYLLAGDQIKAAAEQYARTDAEQAAAFRDKMDGVGGWKDEGIGRYTKTDEHGTRTDKDVDLDPETPGTQSDPTGHSGGTDRSRTEPPPMPGPDPRGDGYEEERKKDGEDYRVKDDYATR
jgi:hypothetical protein